MGGAEYQMQLLVTALAERGGHEIAYMARNIDPARSHATHVPIQVAKPNRINRFSFLFDAPGLYRSLRQWQPDAIYQRVGCAYTGVVAHYANRFGCKAVWHVAHDGDLIPPRYSLGAELPLRYLERKSLDYGINTIKSIVVQTKHQAALLREHYGREPRAQIHNFHPAPAEVIDKSRRPLNVLWVANLKPIKQPEIFVRLARDLAAHRDVRFTVLGNADSERARHQAFLDDVATTPNLHYLGSVSQAEVNQHFAAAHLLVNTSVVEGFSNTFIQAWMRKVPVLSLTVDPDGVIAQHGLGLVGGDYPSLLSNTRQLLENDAVRTQMGERAQAYALANHSMANVDRLIELLS